MRVKFSLRDPFCVVGLIVLWRVSLFAFAALPAPANDAAFFDGPVVNWLLHGHYINPGLSAVFPISGHQVYAAYPPIYQAALLGWMSVFGATVISAMALHVLLFATASFLAIFIVRKFFPAAVNYALVPLMFLPITFDDRPESLAHNFGLLSLLLAGNILTDGFNWRRGALMVLTLLAGLYTNIIVSTLYFGTGFVALAIGGRSQKKLIWFAPYFIVAVLFVAIALAIAKFEPLWWAGFRENARQTPVVSTGFHRPQPLDLLKLIRTAPVFLVGLALLPWLWRQRREMPARTAPWLALTGGVFVTGGALLVADMALFAPNYVGYILFTQVLLAAGLLALAGISLPARQKFFRCALIGCVAISSVRAVGLTTWGAACAWKNPYSQTHEILLGEFAPFAKTNSAVLMSSAYLYTALEAGVQNPIHSDWYFDRGNWTNNADLNGFIAVQPRRLVVVQYDYYRAFAPLLKRLVQAQPAVKISVRDLTKVRVPDSIPALERVLQHITWAPVIVDLEWPARQN